MPELPEVETIVRDLQKKVLKRTFINVWSDFPKMIKKPKDFNLFKKELKGKKIKKIWRRGKNIIFELSENKSLLIHQKLTGHFLLGKWKFQKKKWVSPPGPLSEKVNTFIHLLFILDNGQMLALSDLRKFAKVELWDKEKLAEAEEMKRLGPEPLEKSFTFQEFQKRISRKKGRIKQVLMDQTIIAGIGNIYSDEILWEAKIHPLREVTKLKIEELKRIYQALKKILYLAIKLKGESISDFRRLTGERGYYDEVRKVYRKEGERCSRCQTVIERLKIGGRSVHFCPNCQK